jgi:prolipoprotein diacylglyceryltransferase
MSPLPNPDGHPQRDTSAVDLRDAAARSGVRLVPLALIFYAVMLAVAVAIAWWAGTTLLYANPRAASRWPRRE